MNKSVKILIVSVLVTLLVFMVGGILTGVFTVFIILFVLSLFFGISLILKSFTDHTKFMKEFALFHGFELHSTFNFQNLEARLFKIGKNGFWNVLIGKYKGDVLKIFNYVYSVNQNKDTRMYYFTVGEVEIQKTRFPYIFLRSESMLKHCEQDYFGQDKDVQIKLTQDFENTFDLFCTQNYEIEALQIFTPELLSLIKTKGSNISIEFTGNKIYFYDDLIIKNRQELDRFYDFIKSFLDHSGPLLQRLHDDFDTMHQVYKK